MLKSLTTYIKNEKTIFGGDDLSHSITLAFVIFTLLYFMLYGPVMHFLRKKTIIRNPEIERIAFSRGIIDHSKLMTKYAANLGATSAMAALSVAMVLLSVAAILEKDLNEYQNFVAVSVCALMTTASVALLFSGELYDAILNPLFEPTKRFRLRKLGADFNAIGLMAFIISMLLAVTAVSTTATIISAFVACGIMTLYYESRFIDVAERDLEISKMLGAVTYAGKPGRKKGQE